MVVLYRNTIELLENIFHRLEGRIDSPIQKPFGQDVRHFFYRYKKQTLETALVQKLARVITGLHSCLLLLQAGFFQEMAVLQRVLDDLDEEIMFLVAGRLTGTWGDTHEKFLTAFFSETFVDPLNPETALDVKRKAVSRKDIRLAFDKSASVMRNQGFPVDEKMINNQRVISSVFNGYVHAGSPQILELYGGDPPHYHLNGMLGTQRYEASVQSIYNQFFRGTLSAEYVCLFLGAQGLADLTNQAKQELEKHRYW